MGESASGVTSTCPTDAPARPGCAGTTTWVTMPAECEATVSSRPHQIWDGLPGLSHRSVHASPLLVATTSRYRYTHAPMNSIPVVPGSTVMGSSTTRTPSPSHAWMSRVGVAVTDTRHRRDPVVVTSSRVVVAAGVAGNHSIMLTRHCPAAAAAGVAARRVVAVRTGSGAEPRGTARFGPSDFPAPGHRRASGLGCP